MIITGEKQGEGVIVLHNLLAWHLILLFVSCFIHLCTRRAVAYTVGCKRLTVLRAERYLSYGCHMRRFKAQWLSHQSTPPLQWPIEFDVSRLRRINWGSARLLLFWSLCKKIILFDKINHILFYFSFCLFFINTSTSSAVPEP